MMPALLIEEVQRSIAEPRRERIDRRRHAEIELVDRDVREPDERGGRFRDVARGHDHLRTGGGEHARGFETDAGVATGHDRGGAVEAAFADHLAGVVFAPKPDGRGCCGDMENPFSCGRLATAVASCVPTSGSRGASDRRLPRE